MTELRKFEEQLNRVKRWHTLFGKITHGMQHRMESEHYHDFVYAFFINCYHLKDWILHDDTIDKAIKTDVSKFIKRDKSMILCAKICNGIKHLIIHPEIPEFGGRKFDLNVSENIIKVKYSIKTNEGIIDAFELATECINKWHEFIDNEIK